MNPLSADATGGKTLEANLIKVHFKLHSEQMELSPESKINFLFHLPTAGVLTKNYQAKHFSRGC